MDYNVLKRLISQSVYGKPDELDFGVEMHRLKEKVSDLGLIPVRFTKEVKSKRVTTDDIFILSEYYKGKDRLEWFDKQKSFCKILFIQIKDIDEELTEKLKLLTEENDRNIDKVKLLAEILTKYACISAIAAKQLKDNNQFGLNIRVRANQKMINQLEYEYQHSDI